MSGICTFIYIELHCDWFKECSPKLCDRFVIAYVTENSILLTNSQVLFVLKMKTMDGKGGVGFFADGKQDRLLLF